MLKLKASSGIDPAFMVAICCHTVNVSLSCPSCQSLTMGCETVDMTLRRNGLGQLGFHVRLDGTVAEVLSHGPSKIWVTNAAVPKPLFFPVPFRWKSTASLGRQVSDRGVD